MSQTLLAFLDPKTGLSSPDGEADPGELATAVRSSQRCASSSLSRFLFLRCYLSAAHHQAHIRWCESKARPPSEDSGDNAERGAALLAGGGASRASTSLLLNPRKEAESSSKQETPEQGETLPISHEQKNSRRCGALRRRGTGPAAWAHARVKGCSASRSPAAALQGGDSSAEQRATIPKKLAVPSRDPTGR